MLSRQLSDLDVRWSPTRLLAAAALRAGSRMLSRLARRVARRTPSRGGGVESVYEFYAEASAPEGALYLDGRLVGVVEGVRRL